MGKAVNLNLMHEKKPKKRYFLVPLCVLLLILVVFKLNFDSILFNMGKSAYDGQNYQKALGLFEVLERKDPKNQDYIYYKILSLSKMPLTYDNQTKLLEVVNSRRPLKGKSIAVNTIEKFRMNVKRAYGSNYLEDAIPGGEVVRWSLSELPITYFIGSSSDIPPNYTEIVEKSFLKWQRSSNNLITFKRIDNQEKANIVVLFVDRPQSNYRMNVKEEYNVGLASPVVEGDKLQQMKIELLKRNNLGSFFTPRAFSTVAIHEIGHALGIWGHSINKNNIMFYSADRAIGTYDVLISQEDINTLKLIYSLRPQTTNVKISSEEEKHLINPKIVLGNIENNSDEINSCINFLNKRPDDVTRWLNLSEAYNENQQFDTAIEILQHALSLNPDSDMKYIIYYDFALNHMELEHYDKAILAAINAKAIKDDMDIQLLISEIYLKQKKYKYAEVILSDLIRNTPSNVDAASLLTEVYIKQGKHFEARKVLKEIIKNNPQAKDNEIIKHYSFYTIF